MRTNQSQVCNSIFSNPFVSREEFLVVFTPYILLFNELKSHVSTVECSDLRVRRRLEQRAFARANRCRLVPSSEQHSGARRAPVARGAGSIRLVRQAASRAAGTRPEVRHGSSRALSARRTLRSTELQLGLTHVGITCSHTEACLMTTLTDIYELFKQ